MLHLQASGPTTLADLCGLASLGGAVCAQRSYALVLVDLRETLPQLSFTEHIQLGAHFAREFREVQKVATVVHPRDRVGTSEKAAQRSGLTLCTFVDPGEAMQWLEK